MSIRRTLKSYVDLYRNPFALFGFGPDNRGVRVTLQTDAREREIWLQSSDGRHSVRITASHGPCGMGVTIAHHIGATPLTVRASTQEYAPAGETMRDVREVTVTCYDDTARAAAFSRWYDHAETPDDIALLGPDYARKVAP